jgi:hypothetical protein
MPQHNTALYILVTLLGWVAENWSKAAVRFGGKSWEGGLLNISAGDICFLHLLSYEYAHEYWCSLCEDRKSPASIDYGVMYWFEIVNENKLLCEGGQITWMAPSSYRQ